MEKEEKKVSESVEVKKVHTMKDCLNLSKLLQERYVEIESAGGSGIYDSTIGKQCALLEGMLNVPNNKWYSCAIAYQVIPAEGSKLTFADVSLFSESLAETPFVVESFTPLEIRVSASEALTPVLFASLVELVPEAWQAREVKGAEGSSRMGGKRTRVERDKSAVYTCRVLSDYTRMGDAHKVGEVFDATIDRACIRLGFYSMRKDSPGAKFPIYIGPSGLDKAIAEGKISMDLVSKTS
mgnify:CR=1 FL=1